MKKKNVLAPTIRRALCAELALAAMLAVPAQAQAVADGESGAVDMVAPGGKSDEIIVTGTLIRSAEKTGFNQVQAVSAADIQDSGATTVADFLRDVSASSGSSYNESTVLNQSPGATGIALRGLSIKYSLVLVDGQRAAPYAFASGGTDTFFDLNTLPTNLIDRMEIVKTGAVSQYGSDAIAGVVNVITKRNYQGLQLEASGGGAQAGGQRTTNYGVLGGVGDLSKDGYNVTAALSYLREGGATMAQRDITKSEDYLGLNGGLFAQPSSFWMTPGGPQALAQCGRGAQVTSAANNLQTQTPGTVCSQNGAWAQDIAAQTERTTAKLHAEVRLDEDDQAFLDLWDSHNTTNLASGEAGFGANALVPSLYYAPGTGYSAFAPGVGGNSLTYYFPEAQTVETRSDFYRVATGVKGWFDTVGLGDWDWTASYGHSHSLASNRYTNQVNASVVDTYLSGVTMSSFSPETLDSLPGVLGTSRDKAESMLDTIDATLSTPDLFTLPAGKVGVAFGGQFQHQSEFIGPGSTEFVNPYTQASTGQRNVGAGYYQVDVPLLEDLSFSQSGRYDYYNDFGGVFSPRYALRYQPADELTFYASYNVGFRAPTLIELHEQGSVTYQVVGNQNVNEYFIGNPNLQPEHTKNYNIGFKASPTSNTDIGFDYYKINVSNVISQANIVSEVAANPGQPVYALPYENISYLHTDGFEVTAKQALPVDDVGTFTLSGDWAYVWHFGVPANIVPNFAGNNGANDTVFGGALPHWKGNTSLNWAKDDWAATASWQFTGPYKQVITTGSTAPAYSLANLSVSYTGFKHLKLFASIDNIFDASPPFDPVWTLTYRGYYDPSQYDYIGRYGQVGATYTF